MHTLAGFLLSCARINLSEMRLLIAQAASLSFISLEIEPIAHFCREVLQTKIPQKALFSPTPRCPSQTVISFKVIIIRLLLQKEKASTETLSPAKALLLMLKKRFFLL